MARTGSHTSNQSRNREYEQGLLSKECLQLPKGILEGSTCLRYVIAFKIATPEFLRG